MTEDFNSMTLDELKALKKKVDKAIDSFETRRKQVAIEALQAAAKEQGFNLADLIEAAQATGKPRGAAAPKYANPHNKDETWSGRGRKPRWFVEATEAGKSPEDMAI